MDVGMDTGDMISKEEIPILDSDNLESIHDKLSVVGADLLIKTLPSIFDGTNKREKQNEDEATYAYNIKREEEHIDFSKTSIQVYNQIRGLNSFPGAYFMLDGKRFKVWESIIGNEYSESGFAPHAVAIHIVYFDSDKNLRIRHFVSNTNDDISDPAQKFYEAVTQLVEWNKEHQLDTIAIKTFEKIYEEQSYPGLGVIKKLSLMHHLELMGRYLDGQV